MVRAATLTTVTPFFFLSRQRAVVILSAKRDSARSEGPPERSEGSAFQRGARVSARSEEPALSAAKGPQKQVLRACGAQDDKGARFRIRKKGERGEESKSRSFAPSGLRACPERSEGMTSALAYVKKEGEGES